MKLHNKIKEADFKITDKLEIRYKKGYGFWVIKQSKDAFGDNWDAYFNCFKCIPLAIGFKEQYGFGYKDLKPFFFKTFDEALSFVDKVDEVGYWEYNRETHEKIFDTILRKGKFENILQDFVKNKDVYLDKIGGKE